MDEQIVTLLGLTDRLKMNEQRVTLPEVNDRIIRKTTDNKRLFLLHIRFKGCVSVIVKITMKLGKILSKNYARSIIIFAKFLFNLILRAILFRHCLISQ